MNSKFADTSTTIRLIFHEKSLKIDDIFRYENPIFNSNVMVLSNSIWTGIQFKPIHSWSSAIEITVIYHVQLSFIAMIVNRDRFDKLIHVRLNSYFWCEEKVNTDNWRMDWKSHKIAESHLRIFQYTTESSVLSILLFPWL